MKTFGQVIEANKGYTTGFDYMRLVLAVGVVAVHSVEVCIGGDATQQLAKAKWGNVMFLILPMFFCLSGFLVASSLLRSRYLLEFLGLRALRILPALAVEICLSALILGPLLTQSSLHEYLSDKHFWTYFENIIGSVHLKLPGVFLANPVANIVNNPLWTVPFEMECYVLLFTLALLGIAKRPKLLLATFLLAEVVAMAFYPVGPSANMTGRQLVMFFASGLTLFMWRDKIPHHPALFIVCFVLCLLKLKSYHVLYLLIIPMAYVTAYLGLLAPKKLPVLFTGDYSYGIYLYAFPIQQAVYQLVPEARVWYANFPLSIFFVGLFAAFSWHVVEKPALRLKRYLKRSDKAPSPDIPRPVLQAPL